MRVRTTLLRNALSFSSLSRFSSSALSVCIPGARQRTREPAETAGYTRTSSPSLSTSIFSSFSCWRSASAYPRIFSSPSFALGFSSSLPALSLSLSRSTSIFASRPGALSPSRDGDGPPLRLGGLRLRGGGLRLLSKLGLLLLLLGGGGERLRLGLRRLP